MSVCGKAMDHAVKKTLLAVLGEHTEQGPWYAAMGLDHEGHSASCTFCVIGRELGHSKPSSSGC